MFPGWQLLSTFFLMAREHTYTTHIHHVMNVLHTSEPQSPLLEQVA